MPHLDDGVIHALLDGEIPSAELPPIQQHLDRCAECRARLAEEQDLVAVSDQLIETIELPPAPTRTALVPRRNWPRNLAWAASIVAAAGLGYSARESGGVLPRQEAVATRIDSALLAPPPPPAAIAQAPAPIARAPVVRPPAARRAKAATELSENNAIAPAVAAPSPEPSRAESVLATGRVQAESTVAAKATPLRLDEIVTTGGALASGRLQSSSPMTVLFPEAIRLLGGTIRLISGMVPKRLEAMGRTVRVVYAVSAGELVLSEELVGGEVRFVLTGPHGFPADSLARLRERVRD